MNRLYKLLPLFFFLKACGSQDYGESPPKAEAKPEPVVQQEPYNWEEAVENSRLLSLKPVRGPSTNKEIASSGLTEVADCPTDSVCLKNPFIGSKQLTGLATVNSLFDLTNNEDQSTLTYKGPGFLFVEAEVIELPGNLVLQSCAKKTIFSAREIQGTGTIRTNSNLCTSSDSGDLVLSALSIDRLTLDASGFDGKNGTAANPDGVPLKAADGSSSAVKYSVNWGTPFQGKLCITELACHWDGNSHPDQTYKENMDLLRRAKFLEMDKIESFIKESSNDGRHWWCWVENREEDDFYKHLYFNWKISADFSKLQGGNATIFEAGSDGSDGGKAGEIVVVTLDDYIDIISSEGGAAGKGGESFAQLPGQGAKLPNPKYESEDVVWGGTAYCLRMDKYLDGRPRLIMGQEFVFGGRKKITFEVGKDYESPSTGSKILGHQLEKRNDGYYGADGKIAYTAHYPLDGSPGKQGAPRLRNMASLDEFAEAAEDEIESGTLPRSITLELEDES